MSHSLPPIHLNDYQDAEIADYRALVEQAILGLIFGLLSPLALVSPILLVMALFGIFFSIWAIRRIKKNPPAMLGRKPAVIGLTLSLLFFAASPTDFFVYRHIIYDEARPYADMWLKYLLDNQPQKAIQLTNAPESKKPALNSSSDDDSSDAKTQQDLEGFVANPLVRTLLALGPRAQVRFYQYGDQAHDKNKDVVAFVYAITFDDAGERKSFFVNVVLHRTKYSSDNIVWVVSGTKGGVKPEGWQ